MMMNVSALVQVKAFARQDGVFLALLWLCSFLLMVLAPASSLGGLLALATPFFVGWLLVRFRNHALGGFISFRRGLAFSWFTFFYASLLFAVAQYVYFRYFDHGAMMGMLVTSIKALEEVYRANGAATARQLGELRQAMTLVGQLSPIELAFIFMMQNIFSGAVLGFPIALVCRRAPHS